MMKKMLVLTLVLVLGSMASAANLLNHWALDEGSGLTAADSVGGITGNLVGMDGSEWTSGVNNGALQFSGQGTRVEANGATHFMQDCAITVWIKPDAGNKPWTGIMGVRNALGTGTWALLIESGQNKPDWTGVVTPGQVGFMWGGWYWNVDTGVFYTPGAWALMGLSPDTTNGGFNLYLHDTATGVTQSSWIQSRAEGGMYIQPQAFDAINIGSDWIGAGWEGVRDFKGALDDVMIWDDTMSLSEFEALVPEPMTLGLLAVGSLVTLRRRR